MAYSLNIGDLPVNAEIPILKPIRVIRPIPNGKYLEHTIINVKTEGNKIIVDIPQIELRTINGINSRWSEFGSKMDSTLYWNPLSAQWIVCVDFLKTELVRGNAKLVTPENGPGVSMMNHVLTVM